MQNMMGLAPDINILEAMEIFKNFSDEDLKDYFNDPTLSAVAAGEMDRRLRVRRDFESRRQQNQGTVVDQLQAMLLSPPQEMPAQQMPPQQMPDQQMAAQQPPNVPQGLPAQRLGRHRSGAASRRPHSRVRGAQARRAALARPHARRLIRRRGVGAASGGIASGRRPVRASRDDRIHENRCTGG